MEAFEIVCSAPRRSGKLELITEALCLYLTKRGIKPLVDNAGNVYAARKQDPSITYPVLVLCLQVHMDMVAFCKEGHKHNFDTQPIIPMVDKVDGELVIKSSEPTTLGADNGIGMAACMAILTDESIKTGRVEAFFTVDEETTMYGVKNMTAGTLEARLLLNCDSEDVRTIVNSACGGETNYLDLGPVKIDTNRPASAAVIKVSGLQGGHSGLDISKGRGNAIRIMAQVIMEAITRFGGSIVCWASGSAHNAIPSSGEATVCFPKADSAGDFVEMQQEINDKIKPEFAQSDKDLTITIAVSKDAVPGALVLPMGRALVEAVLKIPNGVIAMSPDVPGLVETSENIGVMAFAIKDGKPTGGHLMTISARSVRAEMLNKIQGGIDKIARESGILARVAEKDSRYLGWPPNTDSALLKMVQNAYVEVTGKTAAVEAIHAGLECGEIVNKHPGMDAVSIGPTIYDAHTDRERVTVASCYTFYDVLQKTILALVAPPKP